ncbi:CD209 antigen-like protein C [Gigantopelta aegis]|uniref:CD209 antigen-like protein C n=1 Tax=Gigantopelta aegis TaxID=1735272 RepID=UPI001B88E636|nr:CD209 antigen-like protein C [Gigantopelta aegis]
MLQIHSTIFVYSGCPEGWLYHEGSYYIFHDISLDYSKAEDECRRAGAVVTTAKSKEERDAILSISSVADSIWIGATDQDVEGHFRWPDGSALTGSNWNKGEPNNRGNEDCVLMTRDGKWNDYPCTRKNKFVCKRTPTACLPGWTLYQGGCYKHHAEDAVYDDAQAVCDDEDAVVSPTQSIGELSFIMSLK